MTRQKSDRAEARRKHRAELSESEAAEAEQAAALAAGIAPATPRPSRAGAKAAAALETPAGRMGLGESFRLASRPADIRGDLAAFPAIATGTKAVWLPALLVVVGAVVFAAIGPKKGALTDAVIGVTVFPPPTMIPAFLAGMLTRRGSWVAGAVAGAISCLAFVVVALTAQASLFASIDRAEIVQVVLLSPFFGAAVGAFAGFYRRFLAFSSPPPSRGRNAKRPSRAKKAR